MKEILAKLICFLSDQMQGEKRRAFIENFEILLEKRDTSDVWRQFAIWVLIDPEHGVLKFTKPGSKHYAAIQRVAQLYKDDCKDKAAWAAARKDDGFSDFPCSAVRCAANAAWAATRKDAGFSYGVASWVADATSRFAWAAAREDAGEDAGSVWAAANAAWVAAVARDNTCQAMADKLLELMKASPELTCMKEILTELRDQIASHLHQKQSFIEEFNSEISNCNISDVWRHFAIWMLVDKRHGLISFTEQDSEQRVIIERVAQLFIHDYNNKNQRNKYPPAVAASYQAAIASNYAFRAAENARAVAKDTIDAIFAYTAATDHDADYTAKALNAVYAKAAEAKAAYSNAAAAYAALAIQAFKLGYDADLANEKAATNTWGVMAAAHAYANAFGAYRFNYYESGYFRGDYAPDNTLDAYKKMAEKLLELIGHDKKILIALRDQVAENLREDKTAPFIEQFHAAYVGKDTSDVWRQFAIWMLVDPEHGVIRFTEPVSHPYKAIQRVAQLYIDDCKDADQWRKAAWVDDDDSDYSSYRATGAAYCATYVAIAHEDPDSDRAAAHSIDNAAIAISYGAAVHRCDTYQAMAEKLLELIKAAPEKT